MIQIRIHGIPAPGGSKTAFPLRRRDGSLVMRGNRPVINMVDAGKNNKQWRRTCAIFARKQYQGRLLTSPLFVIFEFTFARPKSHYGTGRNAFLLRSDAPAFPMAEGNDADTTKLIRSTEDALTGIVWKDDTQIVRQVASKVYGEQPGCTIKVYEIEPEANLFRAATEATA